MTAPLLTRCLIPQMEPSGHDAATHIMARPHIWPWRSPLQDLVVVDEMQFVGNGAPPPAGADVMVANLVGSVKWEGWPGFGWIMLCP